MAVSGRVGGNLGLELWLSRQDECVCLYLYKVLQLDMNIRTCQIVSSFMFDVHIIDVAVTFRSLYNSTL